MDPRHHLHIRKRIYKNLEEYPHPTKWKRYLDYTVTFMGIITPLIASQQAIDIWKNQNAKGISLITWVTFFISSIVWLVYGFVHKEKPVIFSNTIYVFVTVFVVLGILFYQ